MIPTKDKLPAARSARAFAIHRAACEWQIDRPILLRDESDILSRAQITVEPFEHQVKNLLTFCRLAPVALLADDVGLGKTISAGLILAELMVRKKVRKALVVCPSILVEQWKRELTDKFKLSVVTATGKKIREVIGVKQGVIITTYETMRDHLDSVCNADIQMLILDEAHRLRRLHGTADPPLFATRIRQALEQRRFKFVLLLTATPIQNRLWDLYSLIDCLTVAKGHGHPLGTPDQFPKRYIDGSRQAALHVQPHRLPEFRGHVRRYIARTRRAEANLPFPGREVKLRLVEALPAERALDRVLGHHIGKLNKLAQISLAQALMSSPQALKAQLENMVGKTPALAECLTAVEAFVNAAKPVAKMAGLGIILDELYKARPDDFRLVIFTSRKETQTAIGDFLTAREITHGFIRGGGGRANQVAIDQFTKKLPEVHVIVSTEAGSEGVNLQAANVLVNYDLPWNPMVLEQRIGRVQRLGSEHAMVTILNLAVAGSVEERVVARLAEKLQMIGNTLGEIDAILESSTDDEGHSFEEMIRELVIRSLEGKDTEAAVRRELDSIAKGSQIVRDSEKVINEQLGRLDELHASGPTVPNLPLREPGMPIEDFVLSTLAEEGAMVERSGDRFWLVTPKRGRPFKAMIGAAPEGEGQPGITIYAPGEPVFEQLVKRWAAQDCTFVREFGAATNSELHALAEQWCALIPSAVLRSVRRMQEREVFQSHLDVHVQAVVAHDKYETIVRVDYCPEGHDKLPDDMPIAKQIVEEREVLKCIENAAPTIKVSIDKDEGIRAFDKFYEDRRTEELQRAKPGAETARTKEDYTPSRDTRIVGLHGYRYHVVGLQLTVELDNTITYETEIEVIPRTMQVLPHSAMETCALSERRVPAAWLDTCCESKKRILRHLLERSEQSGKHALPAFFANSAITEKRLLKNEMAPSDVSGELAEPELLACSEMSQKKGLPRELVSCDITGTKVLVNELIESEISKRRFRMDQKAVSAVSEVVGHQSEFVTCEVTGVPVLESERVRSDVSDRWFRKDQLVQSEKRHNRIGAADEAVKCAASGRILLRDEAAQSDASGKWVDSDLLVKSEASDALVLESELITCVLTNKRVLEKETVTCDVTGKRALPALMVKSALFLSKLYTCPGYEVRSAISGKPMAPSEAYTCPWLGVIVLPLFETAKCKLTGIQVASSALNSNGELADLRRVLDKRGHGVDAPDVVEWLKTNDFYMVKTPQWASAILSPSRRLCAVHVRAEGWITSTDDGMLFEILASGSLNRVKGYTIGSWTQYGWVWERNGPPK